MIVTKDFRKSKVSSLLIIDTTTVSENQVWDLLYLLSPEINPSGRHQPLACPLDLPQF